VSIGGGRLLEVLKSQVGEMYANEASENTRRVGSALGNCFGVFRAAKQDRKKCSAKATSFL
jgi:hypothetical protein